MIAGNFARNFQGKSQPEDMVSIYQSAGEADDPMVIEGNYLMGDPVKGSEGKSGSGSGIMLGDGGGAHLVCRGNVLVSPGQVGIGVAGGEEIKVEGNVVIGRQSDVSNVGIYVWNQSGKPGGKVTVRDNRVWWINKAGVSNGWWPGEGFAEVVDEGNHFDERELIVPEPPKGVPDAPRVLKEGMVIPP